MMRPERAPAWSCVGVVLAGAVTRGAFEAGALKVLAERGVPVRRIVAASSGALNGTAYAAGVRAHQEVRAADQLIEVWRHHASFFDVVNVNLRDLVRGRGLSDQEKLLALLRRRVPPSRSPDPAPVELHIIVAALNGAVGHVGSHPATTYTAQLGFKGAYFDREDLLEHVFTAAVASSAFPGMYAPVEVPGIGPCVDGGIANSTLISFVVDDSAEMAIDAALMIVPTPTLVQRRPRAYFGRRLLAHVIDMLFDERLYQDLRDEVALTEGLRGLEALARARRWEPEDVTEIKAAIGWAGRRIVPIIPIRPISPLPGDAFSGFFDARAREQYLELGMERANRVLDELGWR